MNRKLLLFWSRAFPSFPFIISLYEQKRMTSDYLQRYPLKSWLSQKLSKVQFAGDVGSRLWQGGGVCGINQMTCLSLLHQLFVTVLEKRSSFFNVHQIKVSFTSALISWGNSVTQLIVVSAASTATFHSSKLEENRFKSPARFRLSNFSSASSGVLLIFTDSFLYTDSTLIWTSLLLTNNISLALISVPLSY